MTTTSTPLPSAYHRIGHGRHTQVFHRPGSLWVVQTFRLETPLTPQRISREYTYLRVTYVAMPDLIGPQRLFSRTPNAPVTKALLVKRFVDIDSTRNLLRIRPEDLSEPERLQLAQFVTITRGLLAFPLAGNVPDTGMPLLPDIIDPEFRNLAFYLTGRLRLVDTNELISTAHLYELIGTNTTLDLHRRRIHAMFFTRFLRLETLLGRSHHDLTVDPLYRGYLTADQINALLSPATTATWWPGVHG